MQTAQVIFKLLEMIDICIIPEISDHNKQTVPIFQLPNLRLGETGYLIISIDLKFPVLLPKVITITFSNCIFFVNLYIEQV